MSSPTGDNTMKYIVNYVAGFNESGYGRFYCTVREADTPEAAGDMVISDKMAEPFSFDFVEVNSVEPLT
jgi:hypothetical protein